MKCDRSVLFEPLRLRHTTLPNRIVRSATYEGLGTAEGIPLPELGALYAALADGGAGTIITGFTYIAQAGRAMQPRQCGIGSDSNVKPWADVVTKARTGAPGVKLFMQLAHTGRQTRSEVTGRPVYGATSRRCTYFRQRLRVLTDAEIRRAIVDFAAGARRARDAGFDGVQIHGAHGYLVHQFLSPWTNRRRDRWRDRPLFLEETLRAVKAACGDDFPVLVKLSGSEDRTPGIRAHDTANTVDRIAGLVDAVEISYGTMEYALNIIRGACPVDLALRVNPLFSRMPRPVLTAWKLLFLKQYVRQFKPFEENYNVKAASEIAAGTAVPVIPVGGIDTVRGMVRCVSELGLAAVSLCRPLIREPDLPRRIENGSAERSTCSKCNLCTICCDTDHPVYCRAVGAV